MIDLLDLVHVFAHTISVKKFFCIQITKFVFECRFIHHNDRIKKITKRNWQSYSKRRKMRKTLLTEINKFKNTDKIKFVDNNENESKTNDKENNTNKKENE